MRSVKCLKDKVGKGDREHAVSRGGHGSPEVTSEQKKKKVREQALWILGGKRLAQGIARAEVLLARMSGQLLPHPRAVFRPRSRLWLFLSARCNAIAGSRVKELTRSDLVSRVIFEANAIT